MDMDMDREREREFGYLWNSTITTNVMKFLFFFHPAAAIDQHLICRVSAKMV